MSTHQGISVGAWVNLDASCNIRPEAYGEELQIEFGSSSGSLGLVITEAMVDKLAKVFADAQARFRELDMEAGREELESAES